MHHRLAVFGLGCSLFACGADGGEDTGNADTSASTLTTTAPAESSSEGSASTGATLECDDNVEFALADGVELGAESVEVVRLQAGEDVQYTVTLTGDAAGTTGLDIVFPGTPTPGMQYVATPFMQLGQPRVVLLPELQGEMDFVSGTVTYTMVGAAAGEVVALDVELEFTRGPIAGCVYTEVAVEAG